MGLQELKEKKFEDIIRSMADYMVADEDDDDEDFDCGYSQKDIDKCSKILDDYIDELIALNGNTDCDKIMKCVEKVVKALNKLNEKTDYCLIETDQREYLCPFIEDAAVEAGLPKPKEDITEEWREW